MIDGKKEIWKLSQPLKEDLVYQVLAPSHTNSLLPTLPTETIFKGLGPELISFCNLDTASTSNNCPYYTVASGLAQALIIEGPQITIILSFLSFISNIQPSFKELLKAKEPRALLLLAYWFAVICKIDIWWLSRRAIREGQATCLYLETELGYDINIQTLLRFPKTTFSSLASQIGRQELTEGPVRRFSSLRLLTLRTKLNLHTGLASRLVLILATRLLESKDSGHRLPRVFFGQRRPCEALVAQNIGRGEELILRLYILYERKTRNASGYSIGILHITVHNGFQYVQPPKSSAC